MGLSAFRGILPDSATVEQGRLRLAGNDLDDLAREYGTPLYLYDERTLRGAARRTVRAFQPWGRVSFAVKACALVGVLRILMEEGVGLDIVSLGEAEAGLRAGVPPARMHLHGNLKTDDELRWAACAGVRAIVLDNGEEIDRLESICRESSTSCSVMLRLDPPVFVQTHPSLDTSGLRSKFGFLWDSSELERALRQLAANPYLHLIGLHVHLGSQIADAALYTAAANALAQLWDRLLAQGFEVCELSVGGGWATPYEPEDPALTPEEIAAVLPRTEGVTWAVEPGRALVARAGIALYRVGAVKWRGGQRLIMVDGGMGDNPRPALYGAGYTVLAAAKMDATEMYPARVMGRYCESGDVLATQALLPDVRAGDLLVLPVSGAYHLSMAGTYNMVPVPPAVLVDDGSCSPLTKRAAPAELLRYDVG